MADEIARLEKRLDNLERKVSEMRSVITAQFGTDHIPGNVPRALDAVSDQLKSVDVALRGDRGDNGMQSQVRMLLREKKERDRDRSQFKWLLVAAILTFSMSALLQVFGMVN